MTVVPEKTIVGFIGLGVMGNSMAGHILNAGYRLHVYNRTKNKAGALVEKGAIWEDRISTLAEKCDVVITIVGFPEDVRQVYLGEEGILNSAKKGSILVDMTSSDPDLAIQIYDHAKELGVYSLDAPVSGGDLGAKNAALAIMAGGDEAVFNMMMPIFRIMGKNIVFQGSAGSGQQTKIANQLAIAAGMIGVCEALAFVKKSGLDPEKVLKSIGQGAAGSWSLNNLGPRMMAGNFDPGFYIKHFIKDMKIASGAAEKLALETPGLDLALSLYRQVAEKGFEDDGTQALYRLFD